MQDPEEVRGRGPWSVSRAAPVWGRWRGSGAGFERGLSGAASAARAIDDTRVLGLPCFFPRDRLFPMPGPGGVGPRPRAVGAPDPRGRGARGAGHGRSAPHVEEYTSLLCRPKELPPSTRREVSRPSPRRRWSAGAGGRGRPSGAGRRHGTHGGWGTRGLPPAPRIGGPEPSPPA